MYIDIYSLIMLTLPTSGFCFALTPAHPYFFKQTTNNKQSATLKKKFTHHRNHATRSTRCVDINESTHRASLARVYASNGEFVITYFFFFNNNNIFARVRSDSHGYSV